MGALLFYKPSVQRHLKSVRLHMLGYAGHLAICDQRLLCSFFLPSLSLPPLPPSPSPPSPPSPSPSLSSSWPPSPIYKVQPAKIVALVEKYERTKLGQLSRASLVTKEAEEDEGTCVNGLQPCQPFECAQGRYTVQMRRMGRQLRRATLWTPLSRGNGLLSKGNLLSSGCSLLSSGYSLLSRGYSLLSTGSLLSSDIVYCTVWVSIFLGSTSGLGSSLPWYPRRSACCVGMMQVLQYSV